ncbi:MAG: replication initiation protein [Marinobacterium sp.]|nr:replication initiation protein [Marinobacterium sp.]
MKPKSKGDGLLVKGGQIVGEQDEEAASRGVTQDNALITASYAMNLNEKRLLIVAISQLDPTSRAWKDRCVDVTVYASEWADAFNISRNVAYDRLRKAASDLYHRSVRIRGDQSDGAEIRWISGQEYSKREGRVTITFSGKILHYLTDLIGEFTSYELLGVAGLKSTHSMRLYELASQFKGTGWRHIELDDLRDMFCLEDTYRDWRDLRKRVIERACREITSESDLKVEYEPLKRGRAVYAVKLRIEPK